MCVKKCQVVVIITSFYSKVASSEERGDDAGPVRDSIHSCGGRFRLPGVPTVTEIC